MTHPIQVVPVPGIGEELQKAITPLVEAYQRRQALQLQEQELQLRKQQLKLQQDERAEQEAQKGAAGEALRAMLVAQDQQQVAMPELPPIQSPLGMGSAFMPLESGRQVAGFGPIAMALRNTPAVAIPATVELSRDIRATLNEQRAARQADVALERTIQQRTDPEEQASLRQLVAYRRFGIDLPVDAQRALFPKLFPQGVDPAVATAMLRFGVAGGLTWGQIRSQFGQESMPGGIPDDFRFPITTGATKQTERQMVANFHYRALALAAPMIDNLVYGFVDESGQQHEGTGGLSELTQTKRAFDAAAASGNSITQFFGMVGQMVGNRVMSPDQRALLDASYKYANSLRYLMTGAQSNAAEFQIINNGIVELTADDSQTKSQKRAYRQVMTEAARQLAAGEISAAMAGDTLVSQAQAMGFGADFVSTMQQWRREAGAHQGTAQNVPLLGRDPQQQMTNEELLDLINNAVEGQQRRNFIMGNTP